MTLSPPITGCVAAQSLRPRFPVLISLDQPAILVWDRLSLCINQLYPRSTDWASVRLGVKPPIHRILILPGTIRAHRKWPHRGARPVIRHIGDDRVPRATVRAIGKRIPIMAINRIENLPPAISTGGHIGRNQHLPFTIPATGHDLKPVLSLCGHLLLAQSGDPG